jgi:hypothetical protein
MNLRAGRVVALSQPLIGAFLSWATLFGINLRERSQAQSFIDALNSMCVGTSTLEEVRPMLARYHPAVVEAWMAKQYGAESGLYFGFGNQLIARMGNRFYFLRYVGLAPWATNAEIFFRDNRICTLRVTLALEIKKVERNRVGFNLSTRQSSEADEKFVISDGHVTGGNLYVFYRVKAITLPADATSSERSHAFGYNLSCVTSLGGCQDLTRVLDLKTVRTDWDNRHLD